MAKMYLKTVTMAKKIYAFPSLCPLYIGICSVVHRAILVESDDERSQGREVAIKKFTGTTLAQNLFIYLIVHLIVIPLRQF